MSDNDRTVLRELARRYVELCRDPRQDERRDAWRRHHDLKPTRLLIIVRKSAFHEMPDAQCACADPLLRQFEFHFRHSLFRARFDDDWIFEPWLTVDACRVTHPAGLWGLPVKWVGREEGKSGIPEPSLCELEDASKLVKPVHRIDEAATAERVRKVQDAVGDIIPVAVDRAPACRNFAGDISTLLAQMRGIEQIMWDMLDHPDWLKGVLAFMRDGILEAHQQAEDAGDWSLRSHENQAMPYAAALPDPAADGTPVRRRNLWGFCASQETTSVSPAMFDEFMFQYQIPFTNAFGLLAYGCCEDLTGKIDVLRQAKNLRRIAVSPMADAVKCAEQIGGDYVMSYRPSPADMVAYGFDEGRICRILTRDLRACLANGCRVDITLKDVETVQGDRDRVRRWVALARQVADELNDGEAW